MTRTHSWSIALARTVCFVKCAGILEREAGPAEKIHSVAIVTGTGNTSTMLSVNTNVILGLLTKIARKHLNRPSRNYIGPPTIEIISYVMLIFSHVTLIISYLMLITSHVMLIISHVTLTCSIRFSQKSLLTSRTTDSRDQPNESKLVYP